MQKKAVVILEGPWDLYRNDINKSSVLPFFDGMAKSFNDVEILHSRYYDKKSFDLALYALTSGNYKDVIVYICAHGNGKDIGGKNIVDAIIECNLSSRDANISGVILGSCQSAGTPKKSLIESMKVLIEDSKIYWIAAYTCKSLWYESTLIDLSIISRMLQATPKKRESRTKIVEVLAEGIAPFSPSFKIGSLGDDGDAKSISIKHGIVYIAQPTGKGNRALEVTETVWHEWAKLQCDNEV